MPYGAGDGDGSVGERLSKGVAATFVSRALKMGANALLLVVLARFLLSPEGYGLLYLAISIVGIGQLFGDLGIARSTARYVNEYKESDRSQIPHVLRIGFAVRIALVVSVALVLVLSRDLISRYYGDPELAPYILIGAIYLVFLSLKSFATILFQGFSRVTHSAVVDVVDSLARIAFGLGLAVVGFGALGAMAGFAVAAGLGTVVGLAILYRRYYSEYDPAPERAPGLVRRLVEYSVPLTATKSANVIDKRLDTVLVGFLAGPAAAGFYTVGKQVSSFLDVPARSLGFTISPMYGEEKANERLAEAARMYEESLRCILSLYVPGVVGLMLVADPGIVLVFGTEYASAVPVVQIMGLFVLFQSVNLVTTQALDFLGRAKARAVAKGLAALGNVALNLLLIPIYGAAGAAAATVVTFGAYVLANVFVMQRELPVRIGAVLATGAKVVGISAVMAVAVTLVLPFVSGLVSLTGVILVGVVVWGVLTTTTGVLEIEEIRSFVS